MITKEAKKEIENNVKLILKFPSNEKIIRNTLELTYSRGRVDGLDYAIQAQKPIK